MDRQRGSKQSAGLAPTAESIIISTGTGPATKLDGTDLRDKTGDRWEIQTHRRDFFICESTWLITFIELFKLTCERRIRGEARSVLDWLCIHCLSSNVVSGINQSQVAKDCGVARPNVSTAITKLERHDIVQRGGRGEVFLNPRYIFFGKPTQQHVAVKKWDQKKAERMRAEMLADAQKSA